MNIQVRQAEYEEIAALRELYRQEANCQIMHDSALRRKMADPYLIHLNGRVVGYAGIWNTIYPGRVMEYYLLPHLRPEALLLFREVLSATSATHIEAQTNMPLMLLMLYDCATDIKRENVMFADAFTTTLPNPGCIFRKLLPDDRSPDFPEFEQGYEPQENVLVVDDKIVAAGGFLTHYNPPYGDVYMSVAESARLQGYGSYIVQEVKRLCYEAGRKPAARCSPTNIGSRRTLQKAGLMPCAYMLAGEVARG